jgi:acetyltransferase-like isoleucine patch superfamily enzyme
MKNNVKPIISKNVRLRHKNFFEIGENSVVDDFCYFSTKVKLGKNCHIASGCSIGGGIKYQFVMGDFSSLSSGVKIWCQSNDFVNDLVILNINDKNIGDKPIEGNVTLGKMCGIGSNSVIMPNNNIPEGAVIGALSFVPPGFKFKEWSIYAGVPVKFIKKRNKLNVLKQYNKLNKDNF